MVACVEFLTVGEFDVYSTFVKKESLEKKFEEEGGLPRTMPLITRFDKKRPERFVSYKSFEEFFKNDIEGTMDLNDARSLIDAVFHELEPIYKDVPVTDMIPEGVTVESGSRVARIEKPDYCIPITASD